MIIFQNYPPTSSSFQINLINYNNQSFQSIGHKLDIILDTLTEKPNFIVLSETWNTDNNLCLCNIDGFTSFHRNQNARRGIDVSVLTH